MNFSSLQISKTLPFSRETPMKNFLSIVFYFLISFRLADFSIAVDTISLTQSIIVGQTLVSSGESFVLGFFSPGESKNRYVGIWYKKFPNIFVWVANRENPITDNAYAVLTITNDGNLVIFDQKNNTIWSSNSSGFVANPVAQLLESGNFVVRDASVVNSGRYVWQSFDLPTDTLLPGMKMGRDSNTGTIKYLTSWKNSSDPSPGNFTYRPENFGLPQFVLREGSMKKFRSGLWNGERFSGFSTSGTRFFKPRFVYNSEDFYYTYEVTDNSVATRFMLDELGLLKRLVLNENAAEWATMYTVQNNPCDDYGHCGANGICRLNSRPICECLKGFVPKSQKEWEALNWTSGCVRGVPLDCQKGEGFVKLANVKLPDFVEFWVNKSMNLKECKAECLKNCSCTAYTNSNISKGGSGCLIWFHDLVDICEFIDENSEQDIYVRVSASELALMGGSSGKAKRLVIIVVVSTISGLLILVLACWFIIRKKRRKKSVFEKEDLQLPLFDLVTIAHATKNFSCENRIGEGGFGPVYKGQLLMGQIAVKRLSKNSGQGLEEFKNEVILIAKLQHRNLVRLLGCCIERDERILIYEYMPHKSLDCFIFDQTRRALLDWPRRFDIVMGIARGLLYLHQDSRLRVIHRDLKSSNILLDSELNPKISDFGIARMFGGDHVEAKTKHVIGTYGYMSPEYAIDGKFSVKSDVFSLGVILLEIVSGKRNTKFFHPDHYHNLLGHAWLLWNEDKASELIDPCLKNSCVESQVLRCIQVGLLCVQKLPKDRPAMSSVFLMLSSEGATLPQPKQPGFFADRSFTEADISTSEVRCCTKNEVTITVLDGR